MNRVITSIEYLKKREVLASALEPRWDVIVVDEAHYLAESGTPRSPTSPLALDLARSCATTPSR
ncbi:MAG: hypothetical protein M5U12_00970 [Verrucomicrobia bacterium]|nr:hypothetical protein [Verrucomicrobiota bacterium]